MDLQRTSTENQLHRHTHSKYGSEEVVSTQKKTSKLCSKGRFYLTQKDKQIQRQQVELGYESLVSLLCRLR